MQELPSCLSRSGSALRPLVSAAALLLLLGAAAGQAAAQLQAQVPPLRPQMQPQVQPMPQLQPQPLDNPIVRNPQHRNAIPDTAPVPDDPRNSDTRPTRPAAPPEPNGPRVTIPEPDPSRIGGYATPRQPPLPPASAN